MKQRPRIYYTQEQKTLMWDRWQKGDSIHDIARLFDRGHSSVQGIFARSGGIRPRIRRRSARSLTLAEREEISRGIVARRSLRSIALRLGRAPSTVSREVQRNGGLRGYRAGQADKGYLAHRVRREYRDCQGPRVMLVRRGRKVRQVPTAAREYPWQDKVARTTILS